MSLIVLDQQSRNGTFESGSLPVPAGTVFILAGSTMSDADATDATKKCILGVMVSFDGQNYSLAQEGEWIGGVIDKGGNPQKPSMNIGSSPDINGNFPVRAKVTADTEGNLLNMGLTLGFLDANRQPL